MHRRGRELWAIFVLCAACRGVPACGKTPRRPISVRAQMGMRIREMVGGWASAITAPRIRIRASCP